MRFFKFTGFCLLMLLSAAANAQAQTGADSSATQPAAQKAPALSAAKKSSGEAVGLVKKPVVTKGRIVGSVFFRGSRPEGRRINMSANLRSRCGVFKRVYPYSVNQASKMPHMLVYLHDPPAVSWTRPHVQKMQMHRCEWQPALLGARQGDVLMLQNQDKASLHISLKYSSKKQSEHSAHTLRQSDMWIPQKNQRLAKKLDEPGSVQFYDELTKTWSSAELRIFSHPFFTMTDSKGEFVLADVPVGQYRLRAWNKTLGEDEQIIVVRPGQTTFISLAYNAEGPVHPPQESVEILAKDKAAAAHVAPQSPVAKKALVKARSVQPAKKTKAAAALIASPKKSVPPKTVPKATIPKPSAQVKVKTPLKATDVSNKQGGN